MSKVSRTIKFKVQVVQHFLCTTDGQRKTAARFGVDQSDVRQWVNLYKAHGINGLVSFQRKLSPSEKEAVILYMRGHRLSAWQTAVHFNIKSINTVSTWARRYDEHGLEGLHYQKSGRKKMPKPPVRCTTCRIVHSDCCNALATCKNGACQFWKHARILRVPSLSP